VASSSSKPRKKETSVAESPRSKRKQIVAAAIKVFLKHGYAATTLQKVADEAQVIRATIYSHFADKNELFKAIIEELTVNQLDDGIKQRMLNSTPRDFVYFMRDFVKQRKQDKQYLALLRTVIGESERFPELARLYFQTVYSQGMKMAEGFFEHHPELGVKNAQALTGVVGGSLMAHLIQQELLRGKELVPMDIDALADTLVDLITRPAHKD
jgi:AcrR family transcriptional regulator